MREVNLQEAHDQLTHWVEEALAGEDVIIAREGVPLVRLTPVARRRPRVFGLDEGKVVLHDDFDAPLPDI